MAVGSAGLLAALPACASLLAAGAAAAGTEKAAACRAPSDVACMLFIALLCSQCSGAAAEAEVAGSCAVEAEAQTAAAGLPLGLRKRVI